MTSPPKIGLIGYHPFEVYRSHQNVDLEAVSASITVRGFVANLAVDITFRNKTNSALEVVYICPVDAKAAIYEFEATIDNRTIKAHCMEKKQAEETYKEAIKKGQTAMLAEEKHTTDLIEFALGNMPPGEVAKLHLKMVMELLVGTDGSVSFVMPTIFNPRYGVPDPHDSPFQRPASFLTSSKYTMDVSADIFGSHRIEKIGSNSDPINVSLEDDGMSAKVTQDGGFTCDHDWSLLIYYQSPHRPQLVMESGDRSSTGLMKDDIIMANFFPELPIDAFSPHNELIFVIDRSGSMCGDNIDKARTTLLLFLKSLPHGCRFNIVSFGNDHSALFPQGSVRYTEDTLKEAMSLQKNLAADMGGTEIYGALKSVYSLEPTPGYARQMIVITDGQVWNVDQVLEMVSRHAHETRVFSVGIGHGASTALVKGLAMSGGGRYEMVSNHEQVQMKVMGLIASMLQENVFDITVECDVEPPQSVSLVPKVPPIIFGGQHLILYARIQPKSQLKSVKLTGKIEGKDIVCEATEEHLKLIHDSNLSIHRLAAKAQLNLWEREGAEDHKEESVLLSVSSSVICPHTAFIGVDQDGKSIPRNSRCSLPPQQQQQQQQQQPMMQNAMYRSSPQIQMMQNAMYSSSPQIPMMVNAKLRSSPQKPMMMLDEMCSRIKPRRRKFLEYNDFYSDVSLPDNFETNNKAICSQSEPFQEIEDNDYYCAVSPPYQSQSNCYLGVSLLDHHFETPQDADELILLVSLQQFDGSWCADEVKSTSLLKPEEVESLISKLKEKGLDDACLGTILALAILEKNFAGRKSEWQLVAMKAKAFLRLKGISFEDWIKEATNFLPQ